MLDLISDLFLNYCTGTNLWHHFLFLKCIIQLKMAFFQLPEAIFGFDSLFLTILAVTVLALTILALTILALTVLAVTILAVTVLALTILALTILVLTVLALTVYCKLRYIKLDLSLVKA